MPSAPSVPDLPLEAEFSQRVRMYILLNGAGVLIGTIVGIVLLPFWLLGVGQAYARRYVESLECELSPRHLRLKKGILFPVEHTIPLDNIQDLAFKEGPVLRYFELSTLKIETAGQSGQGGSDMSITGIRNASDFRNAVLAQRDYLTERPRSSTADASPEDALRGERIEQLLVEIRDALRERNDRS